ncbi:hypothetical protein DAI22_01g194200 [Oryza sativa Japonica Group]|nr:hypothetical protein DAI22_01g194200 [Oryza sativa Japonica Group]
MAPQLQGWAPPPPRWTARGRRWCGCISSDGRWTACCNFQAHRRHRHPLHRAGWWMFLEKIGT